jgi:LysR family glycine cleavage system transcriptional activator
MTCQDRPDFAIWTNCAIPVSGHVGISPMRRKLPSFSAIRAFEASARHVSFKEAAEELCLTQSAISHQIKMLEAFLGLPLFRRGVREVLLTREGSDYFAELTQNLDHLMAATERVRDSSKCGPLSVHSTPAFASRWLIPRLSCLRDRHPAIELHISTSLEPADFVIDGIDVDIRLGMGPAADIYVETLLVSSRFPVASPRLFNELSPLTCPDELRRFPLLHDETTNDWQRWFALAGALPLETCPGTRFAHCDLLLQAASEGQGVALAYEVLVSGELSSGRLVKLFDIEIPPAAIYSIATPLAWRNRSKIRTFCDWLLTEARGPCAGRGAD